MRVALLCGPRGEVRVVTLARHDQRREQSDLLAAVVLEDARRDGLEALRLDRHVAVRTVLRPELHVEQPQEVVDLGQRRDGALAAAAAGALLDRDRRRNAEDRIDVGTRSRLHELPRVRVQRFQVAALPFAEHDVERERRLARAGHARHDREAVARHLDVDVLQVVLARAVDGDHRSVAVRARRRRRGQSSSTRGNLPEPTANRFAQRLARVRLRDFHHVARRALANDLAARVAALRTEVDQPVGRADDVEVVLDHQQRMPGIDQAAKRAQQLRDVVEVQARGRLVEEKQRAARRRAARPLVRRRQMAGELQALRLAAGKRRHRLAELEIVQPDFDERPQPREHLALAGEELDSFRHRHVEHVRDAAPGRRAAVQRDLEDLGAVAPPVAVGAAQIHVRQELHLDVLEAVAAAASGSGRCRS